MAPSSLKKMSGVRERKEGNDASLETNSSGRFMKNDLGLTLLPGSQIQATDEKRSGTAAESSPKNSRSKIVGGLDHWKSSETEIQPKHPAHEGAFPNEAKSPSSSPDPGPGLAKSPNLTARERLFSQDFPAPNSTGVVHHNVISVAAAPYGEQKMGTGEIRKANSCQHDDSPPRAAKRRTLGSRASNEMRESKVSKEKEAAFETHPDQFHVHHDQNLSEINVVHSEKRNPSFATIGVSFGGTGGGSGSSKLELCRQTTHRPDTVPARSHQSTNIGYEDTALHCDSSLLAALASRSPVKHRYLEMEKLTAHYQPPKSSKPVSTQYWKHSRLISDTPADIRTQVLKPGKEVNRSWTSHFPTKAKIPRRANLPAPSLLAGPFTPSEDHAHPHPIKIPLTSSNLHAYTKFLSTHPSPSLPNNLSLSKAFNCPLHACPLQDIFDPAHAGNQRQLVRKRSTSLPNLPSTSSPMNMESSNSFEPASMPTPPREQPGYPACFPCSSSLSHHGNVPFLQNLVDAPCGHVNPSFNADNSPPQDWQSDWNLQYQHEASLHNRQNMGFTPSIHPRQDLTQVSNQQHMTDFSVSEDGAMAAVEPQYSRRRLEIKSSYSLEEVKSFVSSLVRQAQTLKAERTSLQSLNATMKKDLESLQQEKTDMVHQIQRYEHTVAQKDQRIKVMQQKYSSLQHQCKRLWAEHRRLLTTVRKEDGTGNPSAIAQKIRWNHSPNTAGAASQGGQPSPKVSPLYSANGAQIAIWSHGFEPTPTGFQGHVQPVSVPDSSEANVASASSRSLGQLGYAAANPNNVNPSETMTIPFDSETNVTKATSRALSQPGFATTNHDNAKPPQPISIPTYPETMVANASSRPSVQSVFAAANHNSENANDGSTRWVPSNQPLSATVKSVIPNGKSNSRPTEHVPTERVTIDLTDDSQPPLSLASRDSLVHQKCQSSVQGGCPPSNPPPGQYLPAQYPARHFVPGQYPPGPSAQPQLSHSQLPAEQDSQGRDLEAMRIQGENFARMAKRPLDWLKGENPFKKATKPGQRVVLPNSRHPSQGNAEEHVLSTQSPGAGRMAPLPETASSQKTKKKDPKKAKVVLDAEAKKERAKGYRKTAAEKKKREKEIAKHLSQDENVSNNAMRAQKQDRRAAKGEKRQEQARKESEEVGPRALHKTLDGRLYQEHNGVQQTIHGGDFEQAPPGDDDSLFGDNEVGFANSPDADIVMHDDDAAAKEQNSDAAMAADLAAYAVRCEAEFEADVDAGRMPGFEQQTCDPTTHPNDDNGYDGTFNESEESEEE